MKNLFWVILSMTGFSLFAQTNPASVRQLAPGAMENFSALLNNPSFVQPTKAAGLGKNWFRMETDAHVFTDEVSFRQVAAVLLDLDNQSKYFNGKKNKLTASVVSRDAGGAIIDFVSITPVLGLQIKTPYRASAKIPENSDTAAYVEFRQLDSDTESNKNIKNCFSARYAQVVTVNGKTYTYIRYYIFDDVNASILPGARNILESSSDAANIEALQLLIAAAKNK